MRLTVIGSGTVAPSATRVCAGYLVEHGSARVLLDCGNGVVHRLASLGLVWPSITHVALSHFHFDHVGDLPALISAFRWGQLPPRSAPLSLIGPPGTSAFLDRFAAVTGTWLLAPETFPVTITELEPGVGLALAPDVVLHAQRVPHSVESVAYSLTSTRGRIVYTGDTGYDDALADWAAGCDVLLTECSLPAALAIPEHLTPETAGALAARARPGRLVLSHFFPPVENDDIPSLVRTRWSGPLLLAHDGTVVDLED